MLIDYLSDKVYPSTLERLTDSFLGIDSSTQAKMVKFFIDEFEDGFYPAFVNQQYTGYRLVDRLLMKMIQMIQKDDEEKVKSELKDERPYDDL